MASPKPQYIANLIVERSSNIEYRKLDEIIYSILRNQVPNLSEEQLWEYIEDFKVDISNELFQKESDSIVDGIRVNFDISEEDGDYYIKFVDTPEIILLRKLQTGTPDDFEIFCTKILDRLGGVSTVIGGPYDGGIDFYSFDLRLNDLPRLSTKGSRIFVIGQAKRYADGNHVTEKDLREFIGSCVNRMDEFRRTRSDQYGIYQPTILTYWTTSDFHSNGKSFAKDMGIWYLNGIALCQLAISLGITEP